jgi:hypothetical protein
MMGAHPANQRTIRIAERGNGIKYLPPYSPNLNPIERLWKVMNEYARNNRFFTSAKEFRNAIAEFFDTTWPRIKKSMIDRINDSFHIAAKSNFSFRMSIFCHSSTVSSYLLLRVSTFFTCLCSYGGRNVACSRMMSNSLNPVK